MRLGRSPIKFADTDRAVLRPVPTLGEHGREVLEEAGYDEAAIAELVSAGAVVLPPPVPSAG